MIRLLLLICLILFSSCSSYYYICTGDGAYAYHDKIDCRGLNNCKGNIISATEEELSEYRPCKICF